MNYFAPGAFFRLTVRAIVPKQGLSATGRWPTTEGKTKMTYTADQLNIAADIAKRGEYVRFDGLGRRVVEVTDYLSNGLGMIYRANGDATFTRIFY